MDSKVQTKEPKSRRTKYIIIGLLAVICVLSYQLYRLHKAKKEVVRRKAFLVGKLHECRVESENVETKYKDMRVRKNQLQSQYNEQAKNIEGMERDLADKQKAHEETSDQLKKVQTLADDNKASLDELKVDYRNAMTSVKTIQGKLEDTISVCNKHKQISQSFNQSVAEKTKELETCRHEKMASEQEKQVLVESEQDLRKKIEEIGKVKRALLGGLQDQGKPSVQSQSGLQKQGQSNAPQEQPDVQSSVVGQVPVSSNVTPQSSQNQVPAALSSQTLDPVQRAMLRKSMAPSVKRITPSFQQPVAQRTA